MSKSIRSLQAGFTYVELIYVTVISVMIFGALFSTFQFTLELISQTRAKLSALSLANERMEFFRSLPYDDVGTQTGIIRGPVANNQTLLLNGIDFTERIVVDYVDGAGDGIGGSDINGILEDYKQVKLEYTWDLKGQNYTVALVSHIMPRSVETNVGGGSIRVNVLDQDFLPLSGATVQISNASATAPLYESRVSNASGQVLLSGVPVDSNYQLVVGGPIGGNIYSTSTTWIADAYIANPATPAFSVSEGGISTQTFIVDALSDIDITTYSAIDEGSDLFTFDDASGISSTTDSTAVDTGDLVLADTAGVYDTSGVTFLNTIEPATLLSWETIRVAADLDPAADYFLRLYVSDGFGGYALIPDSELPGNGLGFTDSLIDISGLDRFLYPTTTIGITLTTSDTSVTPEIEEVEVFWTEDTTVLAGQTLFIRGDQILGTNGGGAAIYKSTTTVTTDASGEVKLPAMEFDVYTATTSSAYDLVSACPANPFVHRGGEISDVKLLYAPSASVSLRAVVQDTLGRSIPGASIRLDRAGYDATQTTGVCGQTYFSGGGLSNNNDYDLEIVVNGYSTRVISPFSISGDTVVNIVLLP